MPGAANGMMFSAAQGSGVAAPRSMLLDGINQWADPSWTVWSLGAAGSHGAMVKITAFGTQRPVICAQLSNSGSMYVNSYIYARGWRNGALNKSSADSSVVGYTVALSTWIHIALAQPAGDVTNASLYVNGGLLMVAANSNIAASTGSFSIGKNDTGTRWLVGAVRCWWRCPVALDAAQMAALGAFVAANDDAGARDYLLTINASAQYHAVTEASDLTSGTAGGIADLTGNSAGSTPWNTTTAGNLSTDVP